MVFDPRLRPAYDALRQDPRNFDTVSFDFFDTLVFRGCALPTDLFGEIGRQLRVRNLLRQQLSPAEFRALRKAAERRARSALWSNTRSTECTLLEIYQQMGSVVRAPAECARAEVLVEGKWCIANPNVLEFASWAHALGLRLLIHSDTYLSAEHLAQIMKACDIEPTMFEAIYTSSDHRNFKSDGGLFRAAIKRSGYDPGRTLHIGDNWEADCAGASKARLRSHHYYRTSGYLEEVFKRERKLLSSDPTYASNAIRVLASQSLLAENEDDPDFRDGAMIFGPVLTAFCEWVVDQLQEQGITTVFPLMREGAVLGKLLHRAGLARGYPLRVVPLYTSRQATNLAALGTPTPETLALRILRRNPPTVFELLSALGLQPAEMALPKDQLDRRVDSPDMQRALIEFACRDEAARAIAKASSQARAVATSYLDQRFGERGAVAIVDLGWGGSIQRNLQRIAQLEDRPWSFTGYYLCTDERASTPWLEGGVVRSFLGPLGANPTAHRSLRWHPEIFEQATTACCGSTEGYVQSRGGAQPVIGQRLTTGAQRRHKQRIQAGIYRYQQVFHYATNAAPEVATAAKGAAASETAAICRRIIEYPTQAEAKRLGQLHHDDNFGSSSYSAIISEHATETLATDGAIGLFSDPKIYWPQGVVARSHPDQVRALAHGWNDPVSLGRTCRNAGPLSQAERQAIANCAAISASHQVVCVSDTPSASAAIIEQSIEANQVAVSAFHPHQLDHDTLLQSVTLDESPILLLIDVVDPVEVTRVLVELASALPPHSLLAVRNRVEPFVRWDEFNACRSTAQWLHRIGFDIGFRHLQSKQWTQAEAEAFFAVERFMAPRQSRPLPAAPQAHHTCPA